MAITDKGQIEYESGQNVQDFELMTTADRSTFSASFAPWSRKAGFESTIRPYGLATGGEITPAISASHDVIDVAALTAYMAGNAGADVNGLVSVAAASDVACARPSTDDFLIHSITVDNTGAVVVISGTEGSEFSEVRGANGGPPFIPIDSIEIGQVRYISQTPAPVTINEIKQVIGAHQERWDFPGWSEDATDGGITFFQALPASHTGGIAKAVYVKGYTPIFAKLERAFDWVPAEQTHNLSTIDTYDGSVGSVSSGINQTTFSALLKDGITDNILAEKNEVIWLRFKQDANKIPYQLTNGKLGIARTFQVGNQVQCSFTLSAESPTRDYSA